MKDTRRLVQRAPEAPGRETWVALGGRGSGKTYAMEQWIIEHALEMIKAEEVDGRLVVVVAAGRELMAFRGLMQALIPYTDRGLQMRLDTPHQRIFVGPLDISIEVVSPSPFDRRRMNRGRNAARAIAIEDIFAMDYGRQALSDLLFDCRYMLDGYDEKIALMVTAVPPRPEDEHQNTFLARILGSGVAGFTRMSTRANTELGNIDALVEYIEDAGLGRQELDGQWSPYAAED